jgi:hypothetical protein
MIKEFLLHKDLEKPTHIQADLAAPMHMRPFRNQKSLHFFHYSRG